MPTLIGIDIGGTTVKLALVRTGDPHQVAATRTIDTLPDDPADRFSQRIADAVRTLVPPGETVDGAGIGCPGIIDDQRGVVVTSANLPSLRNYPLADQIARRLDNVETSLQNDAKAAVLGEYLFGGSKNCRNFVLLTLGTGVGGGVIANGRLLTGADNGATELGHVKIDYHSSFTCGCGRKGCLEAFLGIQGIARIAKQVLSPGGVASATLSSDSNLTTKDITQAAQNDDPAAKEILYRAGTYLGRGIANFVEIFNPEKVVLAGGASRATPFLLPGIRASMTELCSFDATRDRVKIEATTLPDDINVLGAAAVFLNAHT
jgi:glucokinase